MSSAAPRAHGAGRWGGRLTSRPLPESDPSIEALSPDDRATMATVWLGRAQNERRVSDSFAVVRDALVALHADVALIELAARAVDDELRHAELCRIVAARFRGSDIEAPPLLALAVPPHATASPELRHTLHVIGQSCLNETIASAVLEASLAGAKGALVTAALRELLSDEVDHARIGWVHLATVTARGELRAKIERWVPALVRGNLKMWRETQRTYGTERALQEQGALSVEQTEETLLGAIRDLVIPGFDRLGIATTEVTAWLARGAPTDTLAT